MATVNKQNQTIEIRNVEPELVKTLQVINNCTHSLTKERNLVGKKREQVVTLRRDSVKNMLLITAAGITNGMIDVDKYDLLRANVTKSYFKEPAQINAILKDLIAELAKTPADGNPDLSIVELAKMIENPYQFVELDDKGQPVVTDPKATPVLSTDEGAEVRETSITTTTTAEQVPTVDGVKVIEINDCQGGTMVMDKVNSTVYIPTDGTHPVTTDAPVVKKTLLTKIKNGLTTSYEWIKSVLTSVWKTTWSALMGFCTIIIAGIVAGGLIAYTVAGTAVNKVKSFFTRKPKVNVVLPADNTEMQPA